MKPIPEKKAPPMPNNSGVRKKEKEEARPKEEVKPEPKPARQLDKQRSGSTKKSIPAVKAEKNERNVGRGGGNRMNSEKENDEYIEE